MKEVTQAEFYAAMSGDVHPHIEPPAQYPYTQTFQTRTGRVVGKVVGYFADGTRYPELKRYYIE